MEAEKPKKKSGKGAEPISEELEFIYERLLIRSNKDIVEDMKDETTFPPRTIGFIKRRRREFEVAKKVIEKRLEGAYDTDKIGRQKRHQARLAERAQELQNELKTFFPYTEDYTLGDVLVGSNEYAYSLILITDLRSRCLLSHMKAELPELENLGAWEDLRIDNITDKILDTLGLKAEQQQFRGTCKICENWD